MFEDSFRGIADLVLPGTSYLERDGTTVNLEGRLQRQRRAVMAPVPDVTMWIAKLAERFEVEVSPHVSVLFDEVAAKCFGGISFSDVGERAALPPRAEPQDVEEVSGTTGVWHQRVAARRVPPTLQRRRRRADARARVPEAGRGDPALARRREGARDQATAQTVTVSSNGTSVELRARIAKDVQAGVVRVARDHAGDLHATVEVKP